MQTIGQGGTIRLPAIFRAYVDGPLVDPVNPRVDILNPSNVAVATDAVPVMTSTGVGYYDFTAAVDAPLLVWNAHWTATINGDAVEADDPFLVVEAGSIVFSPDSPDWPTVEDLADHLRLDVSELDDIHAEAALRSAKAKIKAYTRQQIELVEDDEVTVIATGGVLILPEMPVLEVTSVIANGTTLATTAYTALGSGLVYRVDGSRWESERSNCGPSLIVVTYSHGNVPIPEPVREVCLSLAARMYNAEPDGLASETIGNYAYKAQVGATDLNDHEMSMLDGYSREPAVA